MYDRFSLGKLLISLGFSQVVVRSAQDSYLENWQAYHLDADEAGNTYKKDSLFIEAIK
jgi:Tfp pilus assembly protein PilW